MPGKILKAEIADIAEALKLKEKNNQGMVLFLGSRAGNLFHSHRFYDVMKGYSRRKFDSLAREEQFAECYKILQKGLFSESEIHTILTAYQDTSIIDAHICLAELVRQGLFDIIVSTSIDNYLENALRDIGMKEQHDFEVIVPDERASLQELIYSDKRLSCKIIKTFGDLRSRVYTVVNRDFYLDHMPGMKSHLENILARDVLVVGFDPIWDKGMLRAFTVHKHSLWLAEEDASIRQAFAPLARQGCLVKGVAGKIGNSEQFLKALYWHFYERMPTNYQLIRETRNALSFMRSNLSQLSQLGAIHTQVQEVYKEVLHLEEKISRCSKKNGGDVI